MSDDKKEKHFDLIVLGGGPGGYPAAIRAAQNGLSVALIEAKELGGTCLNRGCIPSKTLIASAELWQRIQEAKDLGIHVGNSSYDYAKMAEHKDRVVATMRKGLEGLIKANKITLFQGFGKFVSPNEIKILGKEQALISADKIIIATGSEPRQIPSLPVDHKSVLDSNSLLELKAVPKSLLIVGAGIIGSEFASLYSLLSVKVILVELMPRILPMEDKSVAEALTHAFKKRGVEIHIDAQISHFEKTAAGISVTLKSGKVLAAEKMLVAVGRTLNTSQIGLEKAGVPVQDNGLILVNERMETAVKGIYAVGDIASKWWLAHVATHQGIVAAENASGHEMRMHYNAIPSVIFTHPEIATVGMTVEQAQEKGFQAAVGAFPFQALGKSQATLQTEGFAQIVFDKRTHQLLGAQVVGSEASTLIAEIAVSIANELTLECIGDTIHAHPTLPEAWLEASLTGLGHPLHLPPRVKR